MDGVFYGALTTPWPSMPAAMSVLTCVQRGLLTLVARAGAVELVGLGGCAWLPGKSLDSVLKSRGVAGEPPPRAASAKAPASLAESGAAASAQHPGRSVIAQLSKDAQPIGRDTHGDRKSSRSLSHRGRR